MNTLTSRSLIVHSFTKEGCGMVHKYRDYDQWATTILDAEKALTAMPSLIRIEIWMHYAGEGILVWAGESE